MTVEQLLGCMPSLTLEQAERYIESLVAAMVEYHITTLERKAAFIAQIGHESNSLTAWTEYASGAEYEGRKDLGNVVVGDGTRYKGRGPIQLTGRAGYKKYGQLLGIDLEHHPELAATPEVGFRVAGCFWGINGCNALADVRDMKRITERINGGLNGLADRMLRYALALKVLGGK